MTKVIWTPAAEAELNAIADYIASDKPKAAARVVRAIRASAASLSRFPNRAPAGRVENTRELIVSRTPYILAYSVVDNAAYIVSVFDGARDWPNPPALH